jgi:hypothetical protein
MRLTQKVHVDEDERDSIPAVLRVFVESPESIGTGHRVNRPSGRERSPYVLRGVVVV